MYGVQHDLPYTFDPDEPIFVTTAGAILGNQDPNPHWFGHPGSTTIYMLSILYALIYIVGVFLGQFNSPLDFRLTYHNDPTLVYLSGRLLMVIFGVGVIFLTIKIAERLFNRQIALIAGLLIAVSPLHTHFSKLIRTDIQLTFWILLVFWFCLNIYRKGRLIDYVLAGLFSGVAIATKYTATVVILLVVFSFVIRREYNQKSVLKLITSLGASVLGVFISSPFMLLDYRQVLADLMVESRSYHLGHTGEGPFLNLYWYIMDVLISEFTLAGVLIIMIGFGALITSKKLGRMPLVLFPSIFLLFISSLSLRWDRWIIPILPFLCIILAFSIYSISMVLKRNINPVLGKISFIALILIVFLPPLAKSAMDGRSLSNLSTRALLSNWMLENIPPGSRILGEIYTFQLPKGSFKFYSVDHNGKLVMFDPQSSYKKFYKADGSIGNIEILENISVENIEYVILGSMYTRYSAEPDTYSEVINKYKEIIKKGELITEISPIKTVNTGPLIRVYQIPQN
jgi:hypothetical protein